MKRIGFIFTVITLFCLSAVSRVIAQSDWSLINFDLINLPCEPGSHSLTYTMYYGVNPFKVKSFNDIERPIIFGGELVCTRSIDLKEKKEAVNRALSDLGWNFATLRQVIERAAQAKPNDITNEQFWDDLVSMSGLNGLAGDALALISGVKDRDKYYEAERIQGRLKSEDGWFSDGDVGNADWLVDPDGLGYENLICIEGSYKDPDDFFSGYDYTIYLRPWGLDWADIEADQPDGLPDHYDWYLSAIQTGAEMPEVIGGDYGGLAPGEIPDSQMEPQGGNDPNASAVDGTWQAPVYGDYGLSKASATGVVPMTRDELVDRIGFYADSQIGSAPYDSLYNSMGYIHGKPLIDDPRWDTGKTHVYQWSIESGEYATLVFEVTDYSIGIEKLQSVETSPGLLDG